MPRWGFPSSTVDRTECFVPRRSTQMGEVPMMSSTVSIVFPRDPHTHTYIYIYPHTFSEGTWALQACINWSPTFSEGMWILRHLARPWKLWKPPGTLRSPGASTKSSDACSHRAICRGPRVGASGSLLKRSPISSPKLEPLQEAPRSSHKPFNGCPPVHPPPTTR